MGGTGDCVHEIRRVPQHIISIVCNTVALSYLPSLARPSGKTWQTSSVVYGLISNYFEFFFKTTSQKIMSPCTIANKQEVFFTIFTFKQIYTKQFSVPD